MKVYAAPEHIKTPEWPKPFNHEQYGANCEAYEESIRQWLRENGYNGPNSGEIVGFGVADGTAQYMLAEGRKSFLIHLEEVDGYHYRDVEFLPKREILRRIKQEEGLKAIFGRK